MNKTAKFPSFVNIYQIEFYQLEVQEIMRFEWNSPSIDLRLVMFWASSQAKCFRSTPLPEYRGAEWIEKESAPKGTFPRNPPR